MNPGLFFNPNGRITSGPFITGMAIITLVFMVMSILSAQVNPVLGLFALPLYWCVICLYGKRLHDAGLSAWLVLVVAIVFFIVNTIAGLVFLPILAPEAAEITAEMNERAAAGDIGFAEIMQISQEIAAKQMPATLAALVVSVVIVAGAVSLIPTEKADNKHGPYLGEGAGTDSF